MLQIIKIILQVLAKSFGLAQSGVAKVQAAKGAEVKNEILEDALERGNKTEEILKETLKKDEKNLPSFDYSKYR